MRFRKELSLQLSEIKKGIDSNVNAFGQGRQTLYIKLAGCNLSCVYCDAQKLQNKNAGYRTLVKNVVKEIVKAGTKNLTITGGEPLLQSKSLLDLLYRLPSGYKVNIETNGTYNIWLGYFKWAFVNVKHKISFTMSYNINNIERICRKNFMYLTDNDVCKIMVTSPEMIEFACKTAKTIRSYSKRVKIAMSPCFSSDYCIECFSKDLIRKINEQNLDVVFNIQINNLINL
jgi:7-carboxy-7-deazaguanine synthase